MTENKPIYVDGVDVSGCSYGEIEKSIFKCSCEYNVRTASMFCKDNPNCYFKQLKGKEKKLDKIKEILEIHKDNKCAICPKFDECFEHPSCDNIILQIIEDKVNE